MTILDFRNVSIDFPTSQGVVHAVTDISLSIDKGRRVGFIGESGSGKTTTALSAMRMLAAPGFVAGGEIHLNSLETPSLLNLSDEAMRQVRLSKISYIPQGAMNSLNPVMRVAHQLWDGIVAHEGISDEAELKRRSDAALTSVGLDPEIVGPLYPHELSGGMKQRVCIAIGVSLGPDLIIADEPTSALAVITQRHVMQTLRDVQAEIGVGLILIGLAAGGPEGLLAAMLALVLYTALQTGGYAFAATLTSDGRPMTALSALVGYVSHAPARTLAVLLILLGLSGAPPLVGYAAKIALLFAASSGGWLWLAIAAFAAFLACVAVYLRLAIQLASGEDEEILDTRFDVLLVAIVMVAASVSVIGAFTLLGLDDLAWQAAESLAR